MWSAAAWLPLLRLLRGQPPRKREPGPRTPNTQNQRTGPPQKAAPTAAQLFIAQDKKLPLQGHCVVVFRGSGHYSARRVEARSWV
jgi:hypothetical protein